MPLNARTLAAIASRSGGAPQVMAYWLKPSWMARQAASLTACGGLEVGHPLAEVDRPVPGGQPRHLADDRLGKVPDAVGQLHGLIPQSPGPYGPGRSGCITRYARRNRHAIPTPTLLDRFCRYVRIDTQADEGAATYPSSPASSNWAGCCSASCASIGLADAEAETSTAS